ncbi:M3 family metallopeptidase [Sphingobacterium cellulitidis]|uniref:Dipeptidyl carboxypeptidase II n=1 Tax=Sphingobacterium cellulitidis TaxID=1768011 RepID=A0A8H9FXQ8_9SPHI|nr:M3 family metallopeptidase [Sphingobacterium soli]MBA8985322.1 peptidyl-dipeptidase Dcp [Sphingobacterium soli]OYD41514.1 peptidase M3 [Sphingobacterium cellulitidis]GGE10588.1 dipeptidyl carboxypeptidase II [Sphingobacterium soli]
MNKKGFLPYCLVIASLLVGCNNETKKEEAVDLKNPLLAKYETNFEVPPFDLIKDEHFRPAYKEALKVHNAEIDSILKIDEPANFANTILALENAGQLLTRVATVFNNLNSANTNDSIQAIAKELAPVLSAHRDEINMNPELFKRVKTVYDARANAGLDAEDQKLLEETYKGFVRSGANLKDVDKEKLKKINSELSVLSTQFGQNLLAETNAFELVVDKEEDLAGLPKELKAAAAAAAKEKGKEGKWLFTLQNPSVMPFLQYADNRELRKKIWEAYQLKGNNDNDSDTKEILVKIANLRLEKAKLLGYSSHAAYVLEESMAENPANVNALLNKIWTPALAKAKIEAADIQKEIDAAKDTFTVAPYDWRYYQEKIRQKRFALNEEEIKPYFSLTDVREGAFATANKLWGISFVALNNVPVYHPEVEVYEVRDKDGSHLGLLYADFFPRESKRSGAWMTSYRSQSRQNGKRIAPVISIVCNFTKPVGDNPALLTFDEATTLFHEFGHALHGLFSNVKYRSLAGTSVPRDFVELPSQIMENWAADPEVLKTYAKHYQTKEAIPDALIEKMQKAGTFDQGFATVEYLAASMLDMNYHSATSPIKVKANDFEKAAMGKIGLIDAIIPRYRSTYFQHIFSGGYSAGYYSYIWSEVLDSDAFAAFKEKGLYDQNTAASFRNNILEKGGTGNPAEMYRKFRGTDPDPIHLMKKRGLN